MSDDLVRKLREARYVAFDECGDYDLAQEAATALTEARAEIERVTEQALVKDHAIIEAAKLAKKLMTRAVAAESELSTLRARVREVVGLGLDVISEERGWGTYPRMEGSEIYTDADVFSRAARQLNEDLK